MDCNTPLVLSFGDAIEFAPASAAAAEFDVRAGSGTLRPRRLADRRSSGWEMLPLASFEIVEIDLGYATRRECDGRGNCGLERASFVYRSMGQQRTGEVVDVRVRCE